jgi:hypothetical protein
MRTRFAGGGDGGADTVAERFVVGADAEVFVAAGASGLGDDLDLAGVAGELDHQFALRVDVADVERLSVDAARMQTFSASPSRRRLSLFSEGVM